MRFSRLEIIFFIDVVTALIAVGLLLLLRVPPHSNAESAQTTGYLTDLREGIRYIRRSQRTRALFSFFVVISFFLALVAFLTTLIITRSFGDEVWRLPVNEVVFFIDSILGG